MPRKKKNTAGVDPDILDETEGFDEQEPRTRKRKAKAKPKPKPVSRVSRVRSTSRGGRGR